MMERGQIGQCGRPRNFWALHCWYSEAVGEAGRKVEVQVGAEQLDLELVLTWAPLKVNGHHWNRELERKGGSSPAVSIAHSCGHTDGSRPPYSRR